MKIDSAKAIEQIRLICLFAYYCREIDPSEREALIHIVVNPTLINEKMEECLRRATESYMFARDKKAAFEKAETELRDAEQKKSLAFYQLKRLIKENAEEQGGRSMELPVLDQKTVKLAFDTD